MHCMTDLVRSKCIQGYYGIHLHMLETLILYIENLPVTVINVNDESIFWIQNVVGYSGSIKYINVAVSFALQFVIFNISLSHYSLKM